MNKKSSIVLLIIGIILVVLGVVMGGELQFIIAGICILEAIISALSQKHPVINCLIGLCLALSVIMTILTGALYVSFPFIILAFILIIIEIIISAVSRKKSKAQAE